MTDAFRCEAVRKSFRGRVVLDGLNLTVESGQAIGLLGSNGAGKTTLLTALLGLTALDGGRAAIGGEPSASLSAAARGRIG